MIGLCAGTMSGLVGVGGGIIIVPALIIFLEMSQKDAQGISLGILLLPVGILGVWQYYKQGHVDMRIVFVVALAFIVGNWLGSKLSLSLSDEKLKKIFAIFMVIVAVKMLFFDKSKTKLDNTKIENNIPK